MKAGYRSWTYKSNVVGIHSKQDITRSQQHRKAPYSIKPRTSSSVRDLALTDKKLTSGQHRAEIRDRYATINPQNGYSGLHSPRHHALYRKGKINLKILFITKHFTRDTCSAVERSKLLPYVIHILQASLRGILVRSRI